MERGKARLLRKLSPGFRLLYSPRTKATSSSLTKPPQNLKPYLLAMFLDMSGNEQDDRDTIESIIREYVSFINDRNFTALRNASYFAPTTTTNLEYRVSSGDSLENHVNAFEEHCKEYPDRQTHIVDIAIAFVNKDRSRASAFLHGFMSDSDNLEIPGFTHITLRKDGDRWQITGFSSMRGPEIISSEQSLSALREAGQRQKEDMSTTYLRKKFSKEVPKEPVSITFEEDGPEAIKAKLISYAKQFIALHNSTDIVALRNAPWIAPYFLAGTANRTSADINMQTYVERQLQHLQTFPQFSTRVVNVQAELDPSSKAATVFVDTEQEGAPPGVKIPGIGILSWRADELSGKWYFWKLVVMRGNTGAEE
jgi:hypothetical protein